MSSKKRKEVDESNIIETKRNRKTVEEVDVKSFIQDGWDGFVAQIKLEGDGEQTCGAKLYYAKSSGRPKKWYVIEGETGKGTGHAEMTALHHFLVDIGGPEDFDDYELKIQCEAKPCCCHCAVVLGILGIKRYSAATKKNTGSMGKTQWAVSSEVRNLFKHRGELATFLEFQKLNGPTVRSFM